LISKYIGTIPLSGDASCAAEQSISGGPPPRPPVSNAMIAKVGAAARHRKSAAPRAAASPLPAQPPAVPRWVAIIVADPRLACGNIEMSALVVLVVTAPPDARLVAPLGGTVEPLVHAPDSVQSARIGGIGVVDGAVLEHERAHARPIARVRGRVGSACGRELGDGLRGRCRVHRVAPAPVVVFDVPLALLLLGERNVEIEVEVAAERGRPGEI